MTRIWSRIEPGAVAGVSARITLGRKLKQLRVVVFARAMILMIFTVCTLLPGSHASAQENDDAEALNAEVERLYEAGRYDEAIPLAVRALAISEKVLGPEHPQVALSLNNLARLYWAKGDYVRAGPLFERALANRDKVHGPEPPVGPSTLNNVGAL